MNRKGYIYVEPTPTDYVLGGVSELGREVLNPDKDWTPFLPVPETQLRKIESYNCTAEGSSNALEILLKFKKRSEDFDYSQRSIGIAAGTRPPGNSAQKVADTLRHKPCMIPEVMLPFDDKIESVEQYYSPDPLTKKITDIGQTFLDEYEVGYEWVKTDPKSLSEGLQYSPLGVAVYAWQEENGIFVNPQNLDATHWTVLVKILEDGKYLIFDSYPPYMKTLSADFPFMQAMRYSIKKAEPKKNWLCELWKSLITR